MACHQPVLVAADLAALETLPSREVLTGMAEIIKCGFIADKQLVSELEAAAFSDVSSLVSSDMLIRWVKAACDLKARVVAADAKEMGYREILNFGHTVGHGVEKTAGYGRYTHGEAVAIGMVTAAILSYRRGYLSDADCRRIISLIDRWGLPTGIDSLSISEVVQACRFDKKVRSGRLRFVLLESVGKARVGRSWMKRNWPMPLRSKREVACGENQGDQWPQPKSLGQPRARCLWEFYLG